SYQTLQSAELRSKPLRDQLRILEQLLADISAQKIKVNMSLEKLQVHFHSDIIYTDNPNIVQSGRAVVGELDKLNLDVFQTTQNLDQALTQIEGCQTEMQAIRQRIVHEEQQLRNILSPLHQAGDSEQHEQDHLTPFDWSVEECCEQADARSSQSAATAATASAATPGPAASEPPPMASVVASVWGAAGAGDDRTYAEVVAGLRRRQRHNQRYQIHSTDAGNQNVTKISIVGTQAKVNVPATPPTISTYRSSTLSTEPIEDPVTTATRFYSARTVLNLEPTDLKPTRQEQPGNDVRRSRRTPKSPRPPRRNADRTEPGASNVTTIIGASSMQPVVVMSSASIRPETSHQDVAEAEHFGNKTYAEVLKEIAASNQYRIQQTQLLGNEPLGAAAAGGLPRNLASLEVPYTGAGPRSRSSSRNSRGSRTGNIATVSRVNIVHSEPQPMVPKPQRVAAANGTWAGKVQTHPNSSTDRSAVVEPPASVLTLGASEQSEQSENTIYKKAKKSKIKQPPKEVFVTEIDVNRTEASPMKVVSVVNLTDEPDASASAETKISIKLNESQPDVAIAEQEQREHYVTQIQLDPAAHRQQIRRSAKQTKKQRNTANKLQQIVVASEQEQGQNVSMIEIASPKEKSVSIVDLRSPNEPLTVTSIELKERDATQNSSELGTQLDNTTKNDSSSDTVIDKGSQPKPTKATKETKAIILSPGKEQKKKQKDKFKKIKKSDAASMAAFLEAERKVFEAEEEKQHTSVDRVEQQRDQTSPASSITKEQIDTIIVGINFDRQVSLSNVAATDGAMGEVVVGTSKPCDEPFVVSLPASPVRNVNEFRSNLVFEDYDFMHESPVKRLPERESVDGKSGGRSKEVKFKPTLESIPSDGDLMKQQGETGGKTATVEQTTNVSAPTPAGDRQPVSTERNPNGPDTAKEDSDPMQQLLINERWRDNRQKISMITHEEYLLQPVSHIRLSLPKITAQQIERLPKDVTIDVVPLEPIVLETPKDEEIGRMHDDGARDHEDREVATVVSVLDISPSVVYETQSVDVLEKEASLPSADDVYPSMATEAQHSDLDTVNRQEVLLVGETRESTRQMYTTTTTSVLYRTSTITYVQSTDQEEIAEIYTSPTVVEQSVVTEHSAPGLDSSSYSEANRSMEEHTIAMERITLDEQSFNESQALEISIASTITEDDQQRELSMADRSMEEHTVAAEQIVLEEEPTIADRIIEKSQTMVDIDSSLTEEERLLVQRREESFTANTQRGAVSRSGISFLNLPLDARTDGKIEMKIASIEASETVLESTCSESSSDHLQPDDGEMLVEGKLLVEVKSIPRSAGDTLGGRKDKRKKEKKKLKVLPPVADSAASPLQAVAPTAAAPVVNVWEEMKGKKTYAEVLTGSEAERRMLEQIGAPHGVTEESASRKESVVEVELGDEHDLQTFIDSNRCSQKVTAVSVSWADEEYDEERDVSSNVSLPETSVASVEDVGKDPKDSTSSEKCPKEATVPDRKQKKKQKKDTTLAVKEEVLDVIDAPVGASVVEPSSAQSLGSNEEDDRVMGPVALQPGTLFVKLVETKEATEDRTEKLSGAQKKKKQRKSKQKTPSVEEEDSVSESVTEELLPPGSNPSEDHVEIVPEVVQVAGDEPKIVVEQVDEVRSETIAQEPRDSGSKPKRQRNRNKKQASVEKEPESGSNLAVGTSTTTVPLSESPKEIAHLLDHDRHEPAETLEVSGEPLDVDGEKRVQFSAELEILKDVPLSESPKEIEHLLEHSLAESLSPLKIAEEPSITATPGDGGEDTVKHVHFVSEIEILPPVPLSESAKEIESLCQAKFTVEGTVPMEVAEEDPLLFSAHPTVLGESQARSVQFVEEVVIVPAVPLSESAKEIERLSRSASVEVLSPREENVAEDPDAGANKRVHFVEEVMILPTVPLSESAKEVKCLQEEAHQPSGARDLSDQTEELQDVPIRTEESGDRRVQFEPVVEVLQVVPFSESVKETERLVEGNRAEEPESEESPKQEDGPDEVSVGEPRRKVSFSQTVVKIDTPLDDDDFEVIDMSDVTPASLESMVDDAPVDESVRDITPVEVESAAPSGMLYSEVVAQSPAKNVASPSGSFSVTDLDEETMITENYVVIQEFTIDRSESDRGELEIVDQSVQAEFGTTSDRPSAEKSDLMVQFHQLLLQTHKLQPSQHQHHNTHQQQKQQQQHSTVDPSTLPLGSTDSIELSKQNVAECTVNRKQTLVAQSVESILDSLISAELEMNNLPYDNVNDLIKGLQILITNLAEYKQQNYAIAGSLPPNADRHVRSSVEQIDERIDTLRQRAENGLEKIQQTLKQREQRKSEIRDYLQLLEEIERWIAGASIHLTEVTECRTEEEARRRLQDDRAVLSDLREKETYLQEVFDKTEPYLVYNDVSERTGTLRENLTLLIRILREKALILENNIQRLTAHLDPRSTAVAVVVAPQTVDIESQTSPFTSITEPVAEVLPATVEQRVAIPVTSVAAQTQIGEPATTAITTDNILIIQSVANGRETVQISNVPRTFHGPAGDGTGGEEAVVVEAKYTQPMAGREWDRSSELLVRNIPSQFETTFTEPDDTTTEIIVNRDGSKKITLRKVVQPAQSIEPAATTASGKASIVTSIDMVAHAAEPVTTVEGVDVELLPEEEEDGAIVSESPVRREAVEDAAETVVSEILDELQKQVIDSEQPAGGQQEQVEELPQVFDSHDQTAPVELIASHVESPTSTSKQLGDASATATVTATDAVTHSLSLTQPITASEELSVAPPEPVEPIESIADVWPVAEHIVGGGVVTFAEGKRTEPMIGSHDETGAVYSDAANVWPTSPVRGSDYIEIEPTLLESVEETVTVVLDDNLPTIVRRELEIVVPISMEGERFEESAPTIEAEEEIIVPIALETESGKKFDAPAPSEVLQESAVEEQHQEVVVPIVVEMETDSATVSKPIEVMETIATVQHESPPVVETVVTRTVDTIEGLEGATTILETVVVTKTITMEEVIEIPGEEMVELSAEEELVDDGERVIVEKVTHVTTIVERIDVELPPSDEPDHAELPLELAVREPEDPAVPPSEPSVADGEPNLEVQVATVDGAMQSSLKVTMSVDPTETKKVSVSLIEIKATPATAEQESSSVPVAEYEEIAGLGEVNIDQGYEADKTATADAEDADGDDKGKKKRRKRKKAKNDNEKACNTDPGDPPPGQTPVERLESVAQESEQGGFESYQSFAEEDQPVVSTVNVLEESVEPELAEVPVGIPRQIVVPIEVLEAVYIEDVQQQTSPVQGDDDDDAEIANITSERLMVPIADSEQRSMQTSPEPEVPRTSQQTSPIEPEVRGEQQTKEAQTVLAEVVEIETQTSAPPSLAQQEAQTDEPMVGDVPKAVVVTSDSANQTAAIETKETHQQATDTEEIVGPILAQIVRDVVDPALIYRRQSMQTSPVQFQAEVRTSDEGAQTAILELHDANVETETVAREDRGNSPAPEATDSAAMVPVTTDSAIQTSPEHVAELAITPKYEIQDEILIQTVAPPTTESRDMQTDRVATAETDAGQTAGPITEITETVTISTQTRTTEPPREEPADDEKDSKRSKKNKSRKSKDGRIPIEVEVSAQMIVPSSSQQGVPGAGGNETVTVTKTIVTDTGATGPDVGLSIQVEIDPAYGTVEESSTITEAPASCPINESLDAAQSQSLRLSLADYFSIIKSQQGYAEKRLIPWRDINEMFDTTTAAAAAAQPVSPDDPRRDRFRMALRTISFSGEEDDALAETNDLEHVLALLEDHQGEPLVQQQLLFDVVESVTRSLEDLDGGLCLAQQQQSAGSAGDSLAPPIDRAKLHRIYKIRLIRIEEHILRIITYVQRSKVGPNSKEVDECLNHLLRQVKGLEQAVANEERNSDANATAMRRITDAMRDMNRQLDALEGTLQTLSANESIPIGRKLVELEGIEAACRSVQNALNTLTNEYNGIEAKVEAGKVATELDQNTQQLRRLENGIVLERNKLLQLNSLADEYEQTLLEFQDITAAAELFIENEIVTGSLEELQEEMQRYRKFFVNLNHCKAILESLEANLDPLTRQKHAELHSSLYNRTKLILESAVDRAGKLALAASRWTVLEKEMLAESQWLQVAQQRVPDLANVSSADYERYMTMYESLAQDIGNHLEKMRAHNGTARAMQELITAPVLEKDSSDALVVVMQLREEVQLYLRLLTKFKAHWHRYNVHADKLGDWLHECGGKLATISIGQNLAETPVQDMRSFWEIKAQYEVLNSKVYRGACDSFDLALGTIGVTDEQLQRQLHGQLLDNWLVVSGRIADLQRNIADSIKTTATPPGEKIAFFEQELAEIGREFDGSKTVLKSQEDLYGYIERMQMLKTRIALVDTELGQLALALDYDTEKVSAIFALSRRLSLQIAEELEAADTFYRRLEDIETGIKAQEQRLTEIARVLDECGDSVNGKRSAVEKALGDCKDCQDALGPCWNELMRLRQMLHTLPMNLKVSVSPLQTERDLSTLQNVHSDLERRCDQVGALLRARQTLWNKFHRQLDAIQEHVQETEFMMELLQLQESADYNRLLKATERLDTLLADIESRKDMIEDLQTIAQPLVEASDASVSAEIQETVQQISVVWESTRENLRDLCDRYEKAVKLWQHYHDVCDTVKEFTEFTEYDDLRRLEDLPQVEVYQRALLDQRQEVDKLRKLIGEINEQVGFSIGDALLAEIDEYGKKLDDIEQGVIERRVKVHDRDALRVERADVAQVSRGVLEHVQESLQQKQQAVDTENLTNKIVDLRSYLLSLCGTMARLKDIHRHGERGTRDDNGNLQNLHSVSQNLLQDTYQQYQELVQQLVGTTDDDGRVLDFWQEYLQFVQTFLSAGIPSDYGQLRAHREQCLLLRTLLVGLRKELLQRGKIDVRLVDRYNELSVLYGERVERYEERITEIDNRLWHWEKFRTLGGRLRDALANVEREKFTLQLEYINLQELPKLIAKVNALLEQFPRMEGDLDAMAAEMAQLSLYGDEGTTLIGARSEQGKIGEKVGKLQDNVETWKNFLFGIDELYGRFTRRAYEVESNLHELQECLGELEAGQVEAKLNLVRNYHVRLGTVRDGGLQEIGRMQDELKVCISMFDVRRLHKRVWTLWQLYGKLEQRIVLVMKRTEESTRNRKLFFDQYRVLLDWMQQFEDAKLNDDSNRYEACTDDREFIRGVEESTRQELALKEYEKEWLTVTGKGLMAHSSPDQQAEVMVHLEQLHARWDHLQRLCDARSQKIAEIELTVRSLETRIAEIKAWMVGIERELRAPFATIDSLEKTVLDRLLDEYEKLQRSIEANSGNVAEVLNLCELLFIDVQSWNVHIDRRSIQNDAKDLDWRWKAVCCEAGRRKQDLLAVWNMLLELQKIVESHQGWVTEQDLYVQGAEELLGSYDGERMDEELETIAIRLSDVAGQEPIQCIMRRLYVSLVHNDRIASDGLRVITGPASHMLTIWERLQVRFCTLRTELERYRSEYGTFVVEYERIILALTQIDVQVTQIEHLPPAGPGPESDLQRLQELHSELLLVVDLFAKEDTLGTNLVERHSANNAMSEDIRQRMAEYHRLGNGIKDRLDALLERTAAALAESSSVAVQVDTLRLGRSESITAKDAYRYQLETALGEAATNLRLLHEAIEAINANNFMSSTQNVSKASAACESSIELIKHLSTLLQSECSATASEACAGQVLHEVERYQRLLAEWTEKQQQLEESRIIPKAYNFNCIHNADYLTCPLCTNRNWQQIDNDLWRLEQWLSMAEAAQRAQLSSPPSDIDALEDTIQDHREFLLDLDSHKSIIKSLNIVGEHLATHTRDTGRATKLRERLHGNNGRWDRVCNGASRWQSALNGALMENREFHRTIGELSGWLEQTEARIKASEPIDLTSGDERAVEKKYRMFRELRADLMRCEPRVVSLQETTSQLTKYVDANKSEKFDEVYAKLTDLRLRFHSIRRLVEMYIIKIGAALGHDSRTSLGEVPPGRGGSSVASSAASLRLRRTSQDEQMQENGARHHPPLATAHDSSTNAGTGDTEGDDGDVINTTILRRSYRFLGRVIRASLPIQAMLLLLLGVVTLMPHGEEYSCTLANNFARSLEPMLRYPNGPPPI
ncbi:muscle-specific protein 300 kDa-like, partial [Anopheles cruzii]|uniref:muscle-specific protein 300 kDa-like n=1 Tax=Anopheles cruzii TaxID=68878 RepID=UPI0022EC8B90